MAEVDFLERSAAFSEEMEATKAQMLRAEEAVKEKLQNKCYRTVGEGNYAVRERVGVVRATAEDSLPLADLVKVELRSAMLSVNEVLARCKEEPEELLLRGIGLTDSDMGAICSGLRQGGASLKVLDLSFNSIADAGVQQLVSALAGGACPELRELWLGGNAFGPLGGHMLSGGLAALRRGLEVHADAGRGGDALGVPAAPETACGPTSMGIAGTPAVEKEAPVESHWAAPSTMPLAPPSGAPSGPEVEEVMCLEYGGVMVRVVVPVPSDVTSAEELELEVSARQLVVRRCGAGAERLAETVLPREVEVESAKAAFSRKRHALTVTLRGLGAAAVAA